MRDTETPASDPCWHHPPPVLSQMTQETLINPRGDDAMKSLYLCVMAAITIYKDSGTVVMTMIIVMMMMGMMMMF